MHACIFEILEVCLELIAIGQAHCIQGKLNLEHTYLTLYYFYSLDYFTNLSG